MTKNNVKNIAVLCGASSGNDTKYAKAALDLANVLIEQEINLIYGGATVGLMGVLANQLLAHQRTVVGVIPQSLVDVELAHPHLTNIHIVQSMSERKDMIGDLADAFIMLPGGAGSLDEFFEMLNLAQIGHHNKPCAIFNSHDYFNLLVQFLEHSAKEGFLRRELFDSIIIESCPYSLLQKINSYQPQMKSRWK